MKFKPTVSVLSKEGTLSQDADKVWTPEGIAERIMFDLPGGGNPKKCLFDRSDAAEIHACLVHEISKALDFTRQQTIAEISVMRRHGGRRKRTR